MTRAIARGEEGEGIVKNMMTRAALIAVGVVAVMAAGARAAQADDTVTAKIPFAFVVNHIELPAGDYVLTRDTNTPELIEIATAAGRRVALVLTQGSSDDSDNEQPKLEFERIGDQVFLTQVTLAPGIVRDFFAPSAEAPRK
jgi:hypothetical protein